MKKNLIFVMMSMILLITTPFLTSCNNDEILTTSELGVDGSTTKVSALAATTTSYAITPAVNSSTALSGSTITEQGGYSGGVIKAKVIANPAGSPANSFTIEISKQDGSKFSSAGKAYLKLGSTIGLPIKSADITAGVSLSVSITFQVPTGLSYGVLHIYPVVIPTSGTNKYFAEPAMVYTTPLTYASGPYTAGMTLATVDGTTLYASGIGLIENPNNLPNYTYLYQCADFCKNYYRDVYGITFSGWGAAGTWKTTYDSSKFNFYANGGNIPPRIGDILTMSGPYNTDQSVGLGHVGIITEVSNSEIKLANQNGGTGTLKPIGWTIVRNPGNNLVNPGKYKIEGWIRKKP